MAGVRFRFGLAHSHGRSGASVPMGITKRSWCYAANPSWWIASQLALADRRCMETLFAGYDVLVAPGAATPTFDVMLRNPLSIAGVTLEHDMTGAILSAAITMAGRPAVAVPCGFDQYGWPDGLQIAAAPRREDVALRTAALFEAEAGLLRLLPIDPRPGIVPPPEAVPEPARHTNASRRHGPGPPGAEGMGGMRRW
jgi:hypothetical protein